MRPIEVTSLDQLDVLFEALLLLRDKTYNDLDRIHREIAHLVAIIEEITDSEGDISELAEKIAPYGKELKRKQKAIKVITAKWVTSFELMKHLSPRMPEVTPVPNFTGYYEKEEKDKLTHLRNEIIKEKLKEAADEARRKLREAKKQERELGGLREVEVNNAVNG